jgi:hypothetical protein
MLTNPDTEFHSDLTDLGFRLIQEGRGGVLQYSARRSHYLTFWAHHDPTADMVLFTWELAIGELLDDQDMQLGANEPLNQFMFPKHDVRGPASADFIVAEMERIEAKLAGLDLLRD